MTTGADKVSSLSVSELKRALESRGIDFRDCLEKSDLVARLSQDMHDEETMGDVAGSRVDELTSHERRLVALFERCSQSVAFIQTTQVSKQPSQLSLNATKEMPAGTGSGFVWDEKGHIITNFHVIKDAINQGRAMVTLGGASTETFEAALVGVEPEKDLAVLKIDSAPGTDVFVPIAVGSSADLLVGQSVVAIGNPFGLDNTLTTGIVSALGREVMGVGGRPITGCVQTDAAINPGNSGGPLLDSSGRLIGVNTAIISPGGASVGIGFAIPADTVRRVVNQIIRHGHVPRATLGVQVADDQILRDLRRRIPNVGSSLEGVLVMGVGENTPASRAGIRATVRTQQGRVALGDIITSVAGISTSSVEELLSAVEQQRVGDVVQVLVLRVVGANVEAASMRVQLVERQQVATSRANGAGGSAIDVRRRSRM